MCLFPSVLFKKSQTNIPATKGHDSLVFFGEKMTKQSRRRYGSMIRQKKKKTWIQSSAQMLCCYSPCCRAIHLLHSQIRFPHFTHPQLLPEAGLNVIKRARYSLQSVRHFSCFSEHLTPQMCVLDLTDDQLRTGEIGDSSSGRINPVEWRWGPSGLCLQEKP